MKRKYPKNLRAWVSEDHLKMVQELKEKYYVNISQFMRNAIEAEYKKRKKDDESTNENI